MINDSDGQSQGDVFKVTLRQAPAIFTGVGGLLIGGFVTWLSISQGLETSFWRIVPGGRPYPMIFPLISGIAITTIGGWTLRLWYADPIIYHIGPNGLWFRVFMRKPIPWLAIRRIVYHRRGGVRNLGFRDVLVVYVSDGASMPFRNRFWRMLHWDYRRERKFAIPLRRVDDRESVARAIARYRSIEVGMPL